ncbi:hypothetical protein JVU11DRAFT_8579 [Chiua virens]|nr:hypothetical protein JVU11DRAFT_8579 [Chiua virens]
MVLLLFSRSLTRSAIAPVAARTSQLATLSVVARRTLFATRQLNTPPAKASEDTTKKTHRKTAEKKPSGGKRAAPAKRGRPPKNPGALKEKQPKEEKQRVRIPKSLKPPKRAPGAYLLFYSSFVKTQPQGSTLENYRELTKRAGEIWQGYSMAEKQPFYDENEARKTQAQQEREEFFRKVSTSNLKQLNAIRKAQGKSRVRSKRRTSVPETAFLLFLRDFRNSPDAQALINETSPEQKDVVRTTIAAANRWRSMPTEDKAPYFERYKKAKEELKDEASDS